MAIGLNKVSLLGNVGNEPEFRFTREGKEFCTFSLATTDSWRERHSGIKKEKTEWHRIVIFSEGLVEICKNFVKKGSKLFLEGSLQTRKFVDSRSQEVSRTEVVLQGSSTLILIDNKKSQSSDEEPGSARSHSGSNHDLSDLDDELPEIDGNLGSSKAPF